MDILFTFTVGWLSVMYGSVFLQSKSYGALLVSLGALLTLVTASLATNREIADLLLLLGRIAFWGGVAVLATFERAGEIDRLRSSSWKEVLMGKVPRHLQKIDMPDRKRIAVVWVITGLGAAVLFLVGNPPFAVPLLVISVIFGSYYFWSS